MCAPVRDGNADVTWLVFFEHFDDSIELLPALMFRRQLLTAKATPNGGGSDERAQRNDEKVRKRRGGGERRREKEREGERKRENRTVFLRGSVRGSRGGPSGRVRPYRGSRRSSHTSDNGT